MIQIDNASRYMIFLFIRNLYQTKLQSLNRASLILNITQYLTTIYLIIMN